MDFINLSDSSIVIDGLSEIYENLFGCHDVVHRFVEVQTALLIIEIAKRVQDKEKWFPKGKWATIQSIQSKINKEINKAISNAVEVPSHESSL